MFYRGPNGSSITFFSAVIKENAMKDSFGNEFNPGSTTPSSTSVLSSASSSAHSAIDSAAAKAKPAVDRAASTAHEIAGKTSDWLNDKANHLSDSEKKLIENVAKYVDANPLKAVGIALVAGAVIARIL
jgi:ElaB/YqjD/DUF883 family membrane-anchored ribosome-binding protein